MKSKFKKGTGTGKRKRKFDKTGFGYEVCFEKDWFTKSPRCGHGPMLLFERYSQGQRTKSFYACAASRNRKGCHAYVLVGDHEKKKTFHNIEPAIDFMLYDEVVSLPTSERLFCVSCQRFILMANKEKHLSHELKHNVTDTSLLSPSSSFLAPLVDSKVNSQFFITKKTSDFLYSTLLDLGFTHLICLGMPRLHEHIQRVRANKENKMSSYFLDIDQRYLMFWPTEKFSQFNMFNRYFFDDKGEGAFTTYLKSCCESGGKCAVVLDPPFGGLVDCVAETLNWMEELYKGMLDSTSNETLKMFWLYPYFMKSRIVGSLPNFTMLDYQITYDNKRTAAQHSKIESPVRIFTNMKNEDVPLRSNRYRFCAKCRRYVIKENKHCNICQTCPSLSGKTYRHCTPCGVCVKPAWKHCATCNRCQLPEHKCSKKDFASVCHLCKHPGHKRKECPTRFAASEEDEADDSMSASEDEVKRARFD